jgi:hypothetical protein
VFDAGESATPVGPILETVEKAGPGIVWARYSVANGDLTGYAAAG